MKQRIFWILIAVLVWGVPALAQEETATDEILASYTDFYSDVFAQSVADLEEDEGISLMLSQTSWKNLLQDLTSGRINLTLSSVLHSLMTYLFREVLSGIKMLVTVIGLSVLTSYLVGLKDGFGSEGVSAAAFYVCYILIAGIAISTFGKAALSVKTTVNHLSVFMKTIVPVVMTALVTCGAIGSASVLEPVLITVIEVTVTVLQSLMIPFVMIATGMGMVNHLSDRFKTERLTKFIHQLIKWGLSVLLTVFVSVAGLQSIAASGADALTVRLTKFATANLIPVVGGILSESVETVMNCSVLIKNSVGVLGILCLVFLTILPLLKIGVTVLLFRFTAAVCEPVAEPKIVSCLSELANSLSVLFSILAAVTVMFVVVLTIVMHAGNTAVMLGR